MEKPSVEFLNELVYSLDVANAVIAFTICETYVDENPEDMKFKNTYLNKLSHWNRFLRFKIFQNSLSGPAAKPIKSKYLKSKQRWR